MTALTSDRDTVRRNGDEFEFEAASTVYAGSMVCLNADGKLVPASVTAGLSSSISCFPARFLPEMPEKNRSWLERRSYTP